MNKIALCVPTYKNRKKDVCSNLHTLTNKYDVYVYLSEGDEKSYDEYEFEKNGVNVVITNSKCIQEKSQRILDDLIEKGYSRAFIIDDDLEWKGFIITPETQKNWYTYRRQVITMDELFERVDNAMTEYDATLSSPILNFQLAFRKPGMRYINKANTAGMFVELNIDNIKKMNLKYDTDKDVHFDLMLYYDIVRNGGTAVTIADTAYAPKTYRKNETNSLAGDRNMQRKNLCLHAGDGNIRLKVDSSGNLSYLTNWKTIFDTSKPFPYIVDKDWYDFVRNSTTDEIIQKINELHPKKVKNKN